MSLRVDKTNFWLAKGKNVLFIGMSGVGKTALALDTFKRNGVDDKLAYWSSTLLDFTGCPLAEAKVLYFDDLNDEKARAAATEIFNLRMWRGQPLNPDCRGWGCYTSPADEDNDPLDAVKKVFDVVVLIPVRLVKEYFTEKFGASVANAAIKWWDDLPQQDKGNINPRKLEQALDMWRDKGDMRDVLPPSSSVAKLMTALNQSPITEKMEALLKVNDVDAARAFLANNPNNVILSRLGQSVALIKFFLPLFDKNDIASWIKNHDNRMLFDKVFDDEMVKNEALIAGMKLVLQEGVAAQACKMIRRRMTTAK